MPFAPAGKRMALSPDSVFVRSASRHPITDAGLGHAIDRFGQMVSAAQADPTRLQTLRYLGPVQRPEYSTPLEGVEQQIPPNADPLLPRGGRRLWHFDPASHLPVLFITYDHSGREVEYYCYDRIQFPVKLDDADFDPDRIWPARR